MPIQNIIIYVHFKTGKGLDLISESFHLSGSWDRKGFLTTMREQMMKEEVTYLGKNIICVKWRYRALQAEGFINQSVQGESPSS